MATSRRVRWSHLLAGVDRRLADKDIVAWEARAAELLRRWPTRLALGMALWTLLLGCVSLSVVSLDALAVPSFVLLGVASVALLGHIYWSRRDVDPAVVVLVGLCLLSISVVAALPEYFGGLRVNGVLHRSVASSTLLVAVGVVATCISVYHYYGATPRAEDLSRYPLFLVPVALVLAVYALMIWGLLDKGLPKLDWQVVLQPYLNQSLPTWQVEKDGRLTETLTLYKQPGFANHLLGTGILMLLTALISLPIGVGTGVYVAEYGRGRIAGAVRLATTSLRGISVLILGLTAATLVMLARDTPLAWAFTGYYVDVNNIVRPESGSFLPAAMVVSLLVVPVIARATEEGCRSLPAGLREGSLALGATEGYTLWRVTLPWALPNIATGLLLGCAEAAGSLATLLFIAGTGERGVGLTSGATALSYAIFAATHHFSKPFRDMMLPYQYAGAILLLFIALGLSIAALILKRRFAERYRGG